MAIRNIADCYRQTNNSEKAEVYYAKVVNSRRCETNRQTAVCAILMYNAKYDAAKKYLRSIQTVASTDERAKKCDGAINKWIPFSGIVHAPEFLRY
ncbi:MAG: hypothetical protein IPL74_22560 [Bacteroidetes bacterium]|nr:hypothetical protein [Bacteroidota bacterium]